MEGEVTKAFNWDAAFQHVVKEIRGQEADVVAVANEWQEQLREKISNLEHCDFRMEGFIDPSLVPEGGFDVVTSNGSFEAVAKDRSSFTAMMKMCHSLLQQGGYLANATYMKNNTYKVGPNAEKEFHCFYFTDEMVKEALAESGFSLERFEVIKVDKIGYAANECYCYVARKP